MTGNPYIGSSLDDLLEETGDLDEVETVAIKRVIAWQVAYSAAKRPLIPAESGHQFQRKPATDSD